MSTSHGGEGERMTTTQSSTRHLGSMLLSLLLALAACAGDLLGPEPLLQTSAPGLLTQPVTPVIACRAQHPTLLTLAGEGFSPVPFDVPSDPRVALPGVTLTRSAALDGGSADAVVVTYGGEPGATNASRLGWQSRQQMTLLLDQSTTLQDGAEGSLPVGLFDVGLTNPNGASATSARALALVDQPTLAPPVPGIVCLAQGARDVTLAGTTFLRVGATRVTATIGVDPAPFPLVLADCTPVAQPSIDAETCEAATLTLAEGSVPNGYPALVVGNPAPADCVSLDDSRLRVVPAPTLDRFEPPLACVAEGPREVTLHGVDLVTIDGALPAVTLDGQALAVTDPGACAPLETMGHEVQRCETVVVTLPQAEVTEPGWPVVVLANPAPAGCDATDATLLTLVPPPAVDAVEPPVVCLDDGPREVVLVGHDFLVVADVAPEVRLAGGVVAGATVTGEICAPLAVDGLDVQRCERLRVALPAASLAPGAVAVEVTNPAPAGCSVAATGLLTVVDGPAITAAEPPLVCTADAAREVVVVGSGLLEVDGVPPTVTFNGVAVAVTGVDECADVPVDGLTVRACARLQVGVPQGALVPGPVVVAVVNPDPAGCSVTNGAVLVEAPEVAVTSTVPASACATAGPQVVSVLGTGFLVVEGVPFGVTVGGQAATPANVRECAELGVPGLSVQSCAAFDVAVDPAALAVGPVTIDVLNPAPSGCSAASSSFAIVLPPTLDSLAPTTICSDVVETVTLFGAGFVPQATVLAGDVAAAGVQFVDDGELVATFDPGLPAGTYDVTVSNGPGCEATLPAALTVDPTPLVFFVDPPTLYNGIAVDVTIFTSGLTDTAAKVELVSADGLTVVDLVGFASPVRPNRILVTVPAGLEPGPWEVRVTSQVGCVGGLPGGVQITGSLTLGLATIEPAFVYTGSSTAVTLTSAELVPGVSVGFDAVPRVYLSPNPAGAGVTATALRAVEYLDAQTLTAVVPRGLAVGTYDVIVVNPTGAVGLLSVDDGAGLTVTGSEPPEIQAVEPGSLDGNGPATARLQGDHFSTDGVTVTATCREPSGALTTLPVAVSAGTITATGVDVVVPADQVPTGSVCVVTLTNSDGARTSYSAISIRNPAQNLFPWSPGYPMVQARRAPALVAARPTATSRYLVAIGGDAGGTASATASVEAAPVDVFGRTGTWSLLRASLPAPRTEAAAARAGRFVYVLGGNDGSGATDTVWRAQVLDPLAGPEILDLDAELGDLGTGLSHGLWFYRVSALFASDDPSNPGGESLPGEVLNVALPDAGKGIVLTLRWEAIPDAVAYRVYRTSDPWGTPAGLGLLAEVPGEGSPSLIDAGQPADPLVTPLPPGSLGTWHSAGVVLGEPRAGAAVLAVPSSSDPAVTALYVFGGRTTGGVPLDTYRVGLVTTTPPTPGTKQTESQVLGAFAPGSDTLSAPRADLGAFLVTGQDVPGLAAGEAWIYVGPGNGATGVADAMDAVRLVDVGDLGPLTQPAKKAPANAGYGFGDANGFLFLFGGAGGGATAGGLSGEMCTGQGLGGCNPDQLPEIRNWNSLGTSLSEARVFPGSCQESAFFFVVGGSNGVAVTNSVDQTVQ